MNTLKTLILTFISVFLINASPSESLASFTDVSDDHANKTAIEYLKESKIIQGYPDGTFKPDNTINRAEFLKIIIGMSGYNPDQDPSGYDIYSLTSLNFSDIQADEWYIPYLRKAVEDGIINGYPDGTFRPANEIKFVEAAKIIVNSFGLEVSEDKEIWYKPYVEELTENKRVPRTINSFSKNITRGEMAEMVWRVKEDVKKSEDWISYKGLELAMQKKEKDPDDFASLSLREIDISEVENYVLSGYDYDYLYARTFEDDNFKIVFFADNVEGEIIPGGMTLKDKKNDKYYYTYLPIWGALPTSDGKYIFIGRTINMGIDSKATPLRTTKLAKIMGISKEKIEKNFYEVGMCGVCPAVNVISRISFPDLKVTKPLYFGGEEIKISGNEVSFTQYSSAKGAIYCWGWGLTDDGCDKLQIPVITINADTLKQIGTSTASSIRAIHDVWGAFKEFHTISSIQDIQEMQQKIISFIK